MNDDRTTHPDYLRLLAPLSDRKQARSVTSEDPEECEPEGAVNEVRVLIAVGLALVRAGYKALLELDERIEVVGEAAGSHQAVALAARTRPDVVLLDLGLPGAEHLEAIGRLVGHLGFSGATVLVTAASEGDERVLAALRAGALGVLARDARPAALRRAVRVLARGEAVLSPAVVRRLIGELRPQWLNHGPQAEQLEELTEREREVVALVGEGLTNGEIAERLVISPATAKTHVYRAMTKLQARHRAELVVLAYETGLVRPRAHASHADRRILAIA